MWVHLWVHACTLIGVGEPLGHLQGRMIWERLGDYPCLPLQTHFKKGALASTEAGLADTPTGVAGYPGWWAGTGGFLGHVSLECNSHTVHNSAGRS